MYLVSRGLSPVRVLITHKKERATEPMANRLTIDLGILRPNSPLIRKPRKGRIGMSQRYMMSVLHRAYVVDHERVAILEDRQDDGQANRGLSRSHHHHEKAEYVAIHLLQRVGERDEREIHRVEHQLDRHENRNDVAAIDEARHAEPEKNRAQNQVPANRYAGWHQIS